MSSIYELMTKIPAIMQVALDASMKVPELPTLKETAYSMQLVYYWWRDADQVFKDLTANDHVVVEEEGVVYKRPAVPALIGVPERLNFIDRELGMLAEETQRFIDERSLPPKVEYKLRQGYNKVVEARYSNEMSKVYFQDLEKR